jgi:hypothetical protein
MNILATAYLVQQEKAHEMQVAFISKMLRSPHVLPDCPPDCFLWTGTQQELNEFLAAHIPVSPQPPVT